MESSDRERILKVLNGNTELRRLYEEHEDLQSKIGEFDSRGFLTVEEEMERIKLKKIKLRGMDRMFAILAEERI